MSNLLRTRNFSTKKKTACFEGCDWLLGVFLFGTEIGGYQLKNHPVLRKWHCFFLLLSFPEVVRPPDICTDELSVKSIVNNNDERCWTAPTPAPPPTITTSKDCSEESSDVAPMKQRKFSFKHGKVSTSENEGCRWLPWFGCCWSWCGWFWWSSDKSMTRFRSQRGGVNKEGKIF